jgi:hypothetical protein
VGFGIAFGYPLVFRPSIVLFAERIEYVRGIEWGPTHHIELLSLKYPNEDGRAILPLESHGIEAFKNSPLYAMCAPGDDPSEMASSFMGPGPWSLRKDLKLPSCTSMQFTCKSKSGHIVISHVLKFIVRVEGSDDSQESSNRKYRNLYDIIVQAGVKIFSVSRSACRICR